MIKNVFNNKKKIEKKVSNENFVFILIIFFFSMLYANVNVLSHVTDVG